ncbi:hypothetical protein GYMLUDRAFT_263288 [Collybiopsis luxurians FD-317 M1]|uniref:AIG1-type G domain-containing protein n=1 Tax=Collybiopsis luxurians FD-317 M1 TaxID=944289 RepID=A0A0D0CPH9_9AGAR|nr:hypothetical protein GYMLUDRAFT_263288 [Collybiopsis luxurians FD-317 M1]
MMPETHLGPTSSSPVKQRPQVSIILLGATGTGKTTFTNLAGGSKFLVGDGLESCTSQVQFHTFDFQGTDVTLIDVPGFDDTSKSDIDVLKIISDFLVVEYKAKRLLTGILYFHRITDVRMGGASKRNYTMFQKLCGPEACKNVAIVTTRWDDQDLEVLQSRLNELKTKPTLFKSTLDGGGAIFKHDATSQSAHAILQYLLSPTREAVPLAIQRQMIDEQKELAETDAGEELHRDIMKQMEKHRKEMKELMELMEEAKEDEDMQDLERECQELRDRMTHWLSESEKLNRAVTYMPEERHRQKEEKIAACVNSPPVPVSSAAPDIDLQQAWVPHLQTPDMMSSREIEFVGGTNDEELRDLKTRVEALEEKLDGYPVYLIWLVNRLLQMIRSIRERVSL